jgi:hypothetical protein
MSTAVRAVCAALAVALLLAAGVLLVGVVGRSSLAIAVAGHRIVLSQMLVIGTSIVFVVGSAVLAILACRRSA